MILVVHYSYYYWVHLSYWLFGMAARSDWERLEEVVTEGGGGGAHRVWGTMCHLRFYKACKGIVGFAAHCFATIL